MKIICNSTYSCGIIRYQSSMFVNFGAKRSYVCISGYRIKINTYLIGKHAFHFGNFGICSGNRSSDRFKIQAISLAGNNRFFVIGPNLKRCDPFPIGIDRLGNHTHLGMRFIGKTFKRGRVFSDLIFSLIKFL